MKLDLSRLNPRQREAVTHGDGPLLILAGAGSGKTSTISYRIAHLITARHQPGSAILGLSFTRKAAGELKERVHALVREAAGKRASHGLNVTTFHSLCVRILRRHSALLGYSDHFTILDQNDQVDVVRLLLKNLHFDDRRFDPQAILFQIGQAKNRFLQGDRAIEYFRSNRALPTDYPDVLSHVFPQYLEHLRALDAMDFDDLIFLSVRLLEEHEDVRLAYGLKFRHILVDEYQDTNPAQFRLLRLLTERHQNLCVVGDDDQSIYSWRGADARHILEFSRHYPEARTITLDQNYRSTSRILDAANEVIAKNSVRHPKRLWSDRGEGDPIESVLLEDDRSEAGFVAEEILKRAQTFKEGRPTQTRPWKDFAILYRSNPQSRLFEEALRIRRIPYKLVGALSFLDRKEVKDLFCYLKTISNPKDDAAVRRILNWPARGIGRTAYEALGKHALKHGCSFYEALPFAETLVPKAAKATRAFLTLIEELSQELDQLPAEPAAVSGWGRRLLERIGAPAALQAESDDPAQAVKKLENMEELVNALGQMSTDQLREDLEEDTPPTPRLILREFLTRMLLQAQDEVEDQKDQAKSDDRDKVTLLTLHGAKGLEYPIVFLVGLEEGLLPHRRTIDEGTDFSEERRLCYVGMTRARDQLILTRARTRIRYGKAVPRNPSRFLDEVPQEQLVHLNLSIGEDHPLRSATAAAQAQQRHEERVKGFLSQIRSQLSK